MVCCRRSTYSPLPKLTQKTKDNHDKIGTASTNGSHSERKTPRFQWFWQGTLGETARLSPDLTQAVKRHIVVKRIIAARELSENINVPYNDLKTAQNNSLLGKSGPHNDQVPSPLQRDVRALLDFRFQIQVSLLPPSARLSIRVAIARPAREPVEDHAHFWVTFADCDSLVTPSSRFVYTRPTC